MTPDPAKTMGTAAPVFLVLTLVAWLYLLRSISLWIGKTPVPGRGADKMMQQLYSGILVLLIWIFLAALLLVISSKQLVPEGLGVIAWIAHPVSLIAAIAAIVVLYKPEPRWPVAIPIILPILIAGYILYALFPAIQKIPIASAGYTMWGISLLLSISVAPITIQFARTQLDDGSIDATPGPKLDAWMAKQQDERRTRQLEELRKFDDETKLYEVEHLIRLDSPTLREALAFMAHQPNRQAEAIQLLDNQSSFVLHFLAGIDLQPTPDLCRAARGYLHQAVQNRTKQDSTSTTPSPYIGAEFTEGIDAIRWIAKNCGCKAQLAEIEAYARAQQQDSPEVKKFLAALAEIEAEATKQDPPSDPK